MRPAIVVLLAALTGCDMASTPEEAALVYAQAVIEGEIDVAVDLVSADAFPSTMHLRRSLQQAARTAADYELTDLHLIEERGDTAEVRVRFTRRVDGQHETVLYGMVREGGRWKVDPARMRPAEPADTVQQPGDWD